MYDYYYLYRKIIEIIILFLVIEVPFIAILKLNIVTLKFEFHNIFVHLNFEASKDGMWLTDYEMHDECKTR